MSSKISRVTTRQDAAKPEEELTNSRNDIVQKFSTTRKVEATSRDAVRRSTRVKQKSRRKAEPDGDLVLEQAGKKTRPSKPSNPVNKTKESVSTSHTKPAELMAYAVVVSNVKGRRPVD